MCNDIIDGSKPDLIVYYDIIGAVSTLEINSSIAQQTYSQNLYSNKELTDKIGNFNFSTIVFNIDNPVNIKENKYANEGNGNLFLPQGIITYISNTNNYKYNSNTNSYQYGDQTTLLFPIITGTGDYMFSCGFVYILVNNVTGLRTVLVYFSKK